METIPDIVFLIIGLAYLMVLISIRNAVKRIAGHKRSKHSEWSPEDQLIERARYLHHCRHIERHLKNHKSKSLNITIGGLVKN